MITFCVSSLVPLPASPSSPSSPASSGTALAGRLSDSKQGRGQKQVACARCRRLKEKCVWALAGEGCERCVSRGVRSEWANYRPRSGERTVLICLPLPTSTYQQLLRTGPATRSLGARPDPITDSCTRCAAVPDCSKATACARPKQLGSEPERGDPCEASQGRPDRLVSPSMAGPANGSRARLPA